MHNASIRDTIKACTVQRVPLVMQMEAVECGAACLSMILAYWKKWLPLDVVREACGVSRDGARALNMVKAAQSYGLEATGYKVEPEAIKDTVGFPCIIHWNMAHFVVLEGLRRNKAFIADPARGFYTVDRKTFDRSFTGVAISFAPTDAFVPSGKRPQILSFAKRRLVDTKQVFALSIILSLLATVMAVLPPVFSRILVDKVLTLSSLVWLSPLLFVMGFTALASAAIGILQAKLNLKTQLSFSATATSEFMHHLLHLPLGFFAQRSPGDLIARMRANDAIAFSLINTLAPLALNLCMAVIYLVMMVSYNFVLALIGLVCTLLNIVFSQIAAYRRRDLIRANERQNALEAATRVNGFQMIETIKATGSENGFFAKWSGLLANAVNSHAKIVYTSALLSIPATIALNIANTLILVVGCWFVIEGNFLLGMVMAMQGFLGQFIGPAQQLASSSRTLTEMRAQVERVQDVLDSPVQSLFLEETSAAPLPPTGPICFDHVQFSYSALEEPFIKDFSLTIQEGERVGLVGKSGCGKSTIIKLLTGVLEPTSGTLTYHGTPLSKMSRAQFFSSMSAVDQQPFLFEDSVYNNISMWDPTISYQAITQAAKDACIHEDIIGREGGYKRLIKAGGADLSGGQKQRLELARVLAQNPRLIFLDEATSALDQKTEKKVMQNIYRRHATMVIVAHRLSTIKACDRIVVLDEGRIQEMGTHEELLEKGGLYANLVRGE